MIIMELPGKGKSTASKWREMDGWRNSSFSLSNPNRIKVSLLKVKWNREWRDGYKERQRNEMVCNVFKLIPSDTEWKWKKIGERRDFVSLSINSFLIAFHEADRCDKDMMPPSFHYPWHHFLCYPSQSISHSVYIRDGDTSSRGVSRQEIRKTIPIPKDALPLLIGSSKRVHSCGTK